MSLILVWFIVSPIKNYTLNNFLKIKSLFFLTKKKIREFLIVENYTIKRNILRYYLLLSSTTLKLCHQKIRICNSPKISTPFIFIDIVIILLAEMLQFYFGY